MDQRLKPCSQPSRQTSEAYSSLSACSKSSEQTPDVYSRFNQSSSQSPRQTSEIYSRVNPLSQPFSESPRLTPEFYSKGNPVNQQSYGSPRETPELYSRVNTIGQPPYDSPRQELYSRLNPASEPSSESPKRPTDLHSRFNPPLQPSYQSMEQSSVSYPGENNASKPSPSPRQTAEINSRVSKPPEVYSRASARGALFFRINPESYIDPENRFKSISPNRTPEITRKDAETSRPFQSKLNLSLPNHYPLPTPPSTSLPTHYPLPTPPSTAPTVKKLVSQDDSFHCSRFSSETNVAALAQLRNKVKNS